MAAGEYENGGLLRYQVRRSGERLDSLEKRMAQVDIDRATTREQLREIRDDLKEVRDDQRTARRIMLTGFISVTGALLTFSLSILAATGRI